MKESYEEYQRRYFNECQQQYFKLFGCLEIVMAPHINQDGSREQVLRCVHVDIAKGVLIGSRVIIGCRTILKKWVLVSNDILIPAGCIIEDWVILIPQAAEKLKPGHRLAHLKDSTFEVVAEEI